MKYLFIFIILLTVTIYGQQTEKKVEQLLDNRYDNYLLNITRIDSAINLVLKTNDNKLLANIYFQKAAYIYNNKDYSEALKYYIKSNEISKNVNDDYTYYSSLYGIAISKQQLGDYDESIILLKECLKFFSKNLNLLEYSKAYVSTLGRLSYIYTKNNELDKATYYSNLEIKFSKTKLDSAYALKNIGLLEFYKKNYKKSIIYLNKSEDDILKNKDLSWYMIVLQYKGESNLKLGNTNLSNKYYKDVVSLFDKTKIVNNDIRISFERLIDYNSKIGNKDSQLYFINKLLQYDSIFFNTNKILTKSYFKKYENSKLIKEKNHLIKKNEILYTSIFIGIIIVAVFLALIFLKNRKEKNRLLLFIENLEKSNKQNIINNQVSQLKEVEFIENIELERKLNEFELSNLFQEKGYSLEDLANQVGYNRTIVSNYINNTKNKNYNQYINSLRIKLIVKRLLEESKLRDYTIDALAEEAGFKSRKTFSDSFFINTGFRPSFFIKNI